MERTHLAHTVWYINYSDTLTGVFLFVENNIYRGNGDRGLLYGAWEIGIVLSE